MSRPPKHGDAIEGHRTRLYDIWRGIRQRCSNPKATNFSDYGGRGICVCTPWENYIVFKQWAYETGYSEDLSIERRDVNGNYEPSNCYWANSTIQACNKRKRANRKSQYIGVSNNKNNWIAYVGYQKKMTYLGTYQTELEAAQVRDAYIKKHHLPHKLNF